MTPSDTPSTSLHFQSIETAPADAIMGLNEAFLADTHPQKMNLTLGVYKDPTGRTPILNCVKKAEHRILEQEDTKKYLLMTGAAEYCNHLRQLIFGSEIEPSRTAIIQSPGGTAGLRITAGFLSSQLAPIRLWIPDPTWANHRQVFAAEAVPMETYRYLTEDRRSFDLSGMVDDLQKRCEPGDAILLHGCCHNPTGMDPTPQEWTEIARVLAAKRLLPIVDLAYQGFGRGLQEDLFGLHAILKENPEAIVCSSYSKNFSLYSERVGGISLVAADAGAATAAMSQLKTIVRCNYSNPPRHGATIVSTILDDPKLTTLWQEELTEMRTRIHDLRARFVEGMKHSGRGHDFSFLLPQNGMFSFSGLNAEQVDLLRTDYSIYIVGSGRINVAGIPEDRMDHLCSAVASVLER